MSSFLHFPTTVTLLILSLLSFSTAFLVDQDGDPIRNGGNYYIVLRTSGASLTYTKKNEACPLYITSTEFRSLDGGTPVRIFTPVPQKHFISAGDRVTLAFVSSTIPCQGSLEWKVTLNNGKAYVTTGGDPGLGKRPFVVSQRGSPFLPTYVLQYCDFSSNDEVCPNVGLLKGGLLGIPEDPTTTTIISFKKALSVLQMSTS